MHLLIFFFSSLLWLQQTPVVQKAAETNAGQHIKNLKEGNLLVMLPEDSPLPGPDIKTQKYYSLVSAFTEHYKFSKVYFFYRVDARLLRKRDNRARLYNTNWERVPVDALKGKNVFIGTLNFTEEVNLPALSVLDSAFHHLPHPFPNPVRIYASIPFLKVPLSKAVIKLNQWLVDFSNSQSVKPAEKK